MNSNLKKYIVGAVIIVAFVAYLIFNNENSQVVTSANPSPATSGTAGGTAAENATIATGATAGTPPVSGDAIASNPTTNSPTTITTSSPSTVATSATTTSVNAGQYKDGTYTGSVADAFYGNVQVAAVIQGGRLTDVQFLQYPSDQRTSARIAGQAMPILKQEAIAAQSAQVKIVSGATEDSGAFRQSLGVALAEAK